MGQAENPTFKRRYKYYEIFGVSREATAEEIKQCYRQLAKKYHPDKDSSPEALEKMKEINRVYEVLGNPQQRQDYDSSPAECLACGTHEVILTVGTLWRCRHCGCQFNPLSETILIEKVERAAIPEIRRQALRVFQTTQCSWCRKFYTQEPFLCPKRRLQSNCFHFDKLSEGERKSLLEDEKWWWRMSDMLQRVQEKELMAKCRSSSCFALNPNPQKITCWQCGKDTLRCPNPKCEAKPILRYHIERNTWKCPNAGCSKTYAYMPKRPITELSLSQEICLNPNCGKNLYYDAEFLLWRCKNCKRIYTFDDLHKKREHRKTKGGEVKATNISRRDSAINRWLVISIVIFIILIFGLIVWTLLGYQIIGLFSSVK